MTITIMVKTLLIYMVLLIVHLLVRFSVKISENVFGHTPSGDVMMQQDKGTLFLKSQWCILLHSYWFISLPNDLPVHLSKEPNNDHLSSTPPQQTTVEIIRKDNSTQ